MSIQARLSYLLATAAMLAGCAFTDINPRTLNFASLELQSNSKELQQAAENAIAYLELDGDSHYELSLDEKPTSEISALSSKGHASKLRLHYLMTYRLISAGAIAYEGNYRFSQVFENDERRHRANLLERDRFFRQAREAGIESMLSHLRLWATN